MKRIIWLAGFLALLLLVAACTPGVEEPLPQPAVETPEAPEQPAQPEQPQVEEPLPVESTPVQEKEPRVDWDQVRRGYPSYNIAPELQALVEQESLTTAERARIFELLAEIHWGGISQYFQDHPLPENEGEDYRPDGFFAVYNWLMEQGDFSFVEGVAIMSATDGLDGAYSEGWAYLLTRTYLYDREGYFAKLAQVPEERLETVLALTCGELSSRIGLDEERARLRAQEDPYAQLMSAELEWLCERNNIE